MVEGGVVEGGEGWLREGGVAEGTEEWLKKGRSG